MIFDYDGWSQTIKYLKSAGLKLLKVHSYIIEFIGSETASSVMISGNGQEIRRAGNVLKY